MSIAYCFMERKWARA